MPPQWQERHIDDAKAEQGWQLQTSTLGNVSQDTLYHTGIAIERNRHTTARYATIDELEYKAAGNGVGSKGCCAAMARDKIGPEAVAKRRQLRESRERDVDHLSELMAKRLQSIEVRQSGLDESAFAQRLHAREIQVVDADLAKSVLAEDKRALEQLQASVRAREESDAEFVRCLKTREERERDALSDAIRAAEESDLAFAKALQVEEERAIEKQHARMRANEDADVAIAEALRMEEEQSKHIHLVATSAAEDLDVALAHALLMEEEQALHSTELGTFAGAPDASGPQQQRKEGSLALRAESRDLDKQANSLNDRGRMGCTHAAGRPGSSGSSSAPSAFRAAGIGLIRSGSSSAIASSHKQPQKDRHEIRNSRKASLPRAR